MSRRGYGRQQKRGRYRQPRESVLTCQCGKQAYETRKDARSVARREFPGQTMSEFVCDFSSLWHIGHTPRNAVEGKQSKDEAAYRRRPGDVA